VVSDYRGLKVVAHGGLIDGFRLQITLVPEKDLGFAVLANLHETRLPVAATNTLIDRTATSSRRTGTRTTGGSRPTRRRRSGRPRRARPGPRRVRGADAPARGVRRRVRHPAYGVAVVTHKGGKLEAKFSSFVCPLEGYERDAFRITAGLFEDELARFAVKDGKANALTLAGIEFKRK
jgi:hypothetical protein